LGILHVSLVLVEGVVPVSVLKLRAGQLVVEFVDFLFKLFDLHDLLEVL
jgi:hypothetical protein